MLKRIFSLFLCLVLLISAVPVQVFADGEDGGDIILGENELPPIPIDPPETKEEYVVTETVLGVGSHEITLDPGAETTVYAFEVGEKALYRFSVDKGVVGFWGSNPYFLTKPETTGASFEMECWEGPSFMIGVSGAESCTLTITKVGQAKPDRKTTAYEYVHIPDAANMACYTVDGTGGELVVNFASSEGVNLNELVGAPSNIVVLADNDYDYIDYRPALTAYSDAAKKAGNYYLLTEELAMILAELYAYENSGWNGLMDSVEELYEKASIVHTPGEAKEENGYLNTYCSVCSQLLSSEVIVGCSHKALVHVDAKAATCYENGTQEYWYCEDCESAWSDEALTRITNHKNVIIPAGHTDLVHVSAKDATTTENGNIEYWYCNGCETVWQDQALTQITNHKNVIIPMIVDSGIIASGTVGEVEWDITKDGELRVFGEGYMGSFDRENRAPWYAYADKITTINVEGGVTVVGSYAFSGLYNVTKVGLADCVTGIENFAFEYCTSLASITLPAKMDTVLTAAFACCPSLKQILVEEGNPWFYSENGILYYNNGDIHRLVAYPNGKTDSSFTVPETVDGIISGAFYADAYLTEIILPESLEYIGYFAFAHSAVQSITIPAKVTYIDVQAFEDCDQLKTITFQGDAPYIENSFPGVTATAYYPANNATWTADVMQNYGGNITWVPYGEDDNTGSQEKPAVLVPGKEQDISVEGENGYFFRWTAEEDGVLTLDITGDYLSVVIESSGLDPEGRDPADKSYWNDFDGNDDTLVWDVAAGEVIILKFYSQYEDEKGQGTLLTGFEAKTFESGSTIKPIVILDQNPETASVVEFSVTVPAGKTYWLDVSNARYSWLKVEAVDGVLYNGWKADDNGMISFEVGQSVASMSLENTTGADVVVPLVFEYELGHHKNPMALELGTLQFYIPPYAPYGRYYTWTAPADGTFDFQISSESLWQYRISSQTQEGQLHTAEDVPCVDSESLQVKAGDQLTIHVVGYAYVPDLVVGIPADFQITTSFAETVAQPGSSAENPILVEFNMNEEWTAGTATITVEPGTWYYNAYGISGMILTANGVVVETTSGRPGMPAAFTLTNNGNAALTYELSVSYPLGSMGYPAALALGENTAWINQGNDQGYFFTWTAPGTGVLTLTMPQGNWMYTINNITAGTYGDTQWSDSEPVVATAEVKVSTGDQIQVIVSTYDPANPWAAPAGSVTFQAAFQADRIVPLELIPMVGEPAEVVQQADGSYIVFLDKEDVAKEKIEFSIMANAMDAEGNPIVLGPKDLKWTTSDSRIATVKSDKYMAIGNATIKAKVDGACVITAVNNKTKDEAIVTIHVRDYAPRLGATSLSLNTYKIEGVSTDLIPSYDNTVEAVELLEYNSKTKTYEAGENFEVCLEGEKLFLNHTATLKNGTYKLQLVATCVNGETYTYKINAKVANKFPSVTVKQAGKFNTFFKDSTAQLKLTAKDAVITDATLFNGTYVGIFDGSNLNLVYDAEYLEGEGKLNNKASIEIYLEGYREVLKKSVTISTEKKAPKVALSEKSTVVNTALAGAPVTGFLAYYPETEELVAPEHIRAEASFATATITEDGLVLMTLDGKKGGTVNVYVQKENWTEPVKLTHKITVQTKLPTLKMESSSVKLNTVFTDQYAVQYLYLDQRNMVIGDLWLEATSNKESVLQEMDKFLVEVYADGIVLAVDPNNLPKKGTYEIKVTAFVYNDMDPDNLTQLAPKTFKVVVEDKVPTFKLKTSTLKLNKNLNQPGYTAYAETSWTMSGGNPEYKVIDMVRAEEYADFFVSYDPETANICVKLMNSEKKNGTYPISVYPVLENIYTGNTVRLPKPVNLKVQVYEGKPSVTVKAAGKLDTIVPGSNITYTISKMTNIAGEVEDVRLEGTGSELFDVELVDGKAVVTLKSDVEYQKDKSFKLKLVYTIAGQEVAANVTIKVTQSTVKFASTKALNLYQSNSRLACTLVMTAPAGASIDSITLGSKTAKQFKNALGADGITFVEMEDGTILVSFKISNPAYLSYGKSYTVYLDILPEGNAANAKPTSVKLTVKTFK